MNWYLSHPSDAAALQTLQNAVFIGVSCVIKQNGVMQNAENVIMEVNRHLFDGSCGS